jgi:hypothetical protein
MRERCVRRAARAVQPGAPLSTLWLAGMGMLQLYGYMYLGT